MAFVYLGATLDAQEEAKIQAAGFLDTQRLLVKNAEKQEASERSRGAFELQLRQALAVNSSEGKKEALGELNRKYTDWARATKKRRLLPSPNARPIAEGDEVRIGGPITNALLFYSNVLSNLQGLAHAYRQEMQPGEVEISFPPIALDATYTDFRGFIRLGESKAIIVYCFSYFSAADAEYSPPVLYVGRSDKPNSADWKQYTGGKDVPEVVHISSDPAHGLISISSVDPKLALLYGRQPYTTNDDLHELASRLSVSVMNSQIGPIVPITPNEPIPASNLRIIMSP